MNLNNPQYGDTRIGLKFLFLPKKIDNKLYWLRNVFVTEVYTKDYIAVMSNYTDEIEGYEDSWAVIKYQI